MPPHGPDAWFVPGTEGPCRLEATTSIVLDWPLPAKGHEGSQGCPKGQAPTPSRAGSGADCTSTRRSTARVIAM
jgi:hypothetical protein